MYLFLVPEMTYYVSSGTLNPTQFLHCVHLVAMTLSMHSEQ